MVIKMGHICHSKRSLNETPLISVALGYCFSRMRPSNFPTLSDSCVANLSKFKWWLPDCCCCKWNNNIIFHFEFNGPIQKGKQTSTWLMLSKWAVLQMCTSKPVMHYTFCHNRQHWSLSLTVHSARDEAIILPVVLFCNSQNVFHALMFTMQG